MTKNNISKELKSLLTEAQEKDYSRVYLDNDGTGENRVLIMEVNRIDLT